ncbi:TetR/AcrR family transcriptional regulator [Williamsia soli]|uniref:TetR/AcrR family transcriptional regulator n=1 Tax=Williamsia soli TaxID=364929 RepID=UPI001A9DBEDE|nr:TetR/AcrR family transcriptional regulator [Williamsia soli]
MPPDWLVGSDRSDTARARLIDLAGALIAERGIDRFDINDLATRAHCSRATIYRHTGGKKQLIEAVFLHTSTRITTTVTEAVAEMSGTDRARTAIAEALTQIRTDRIARQFLRSQHAIDGARAATDSAAIRAIAAQLIGLDPTNIIVSSLAVRTFLALVLWPPTDPADETHLIDAVSTALLAAESTDS